MPSPTELRAFHLVAEAGSFSQAAREGGVSQSTLSIQVRALEHDSGQQLFERLPRGIRLTTAGERLHQITMRMSAAEAEARGLLALPTSPGMRNLRVVADGAILPARILARLRIEQPELDFTLQICDSQRVIEALGDFRADVGITARPCNDSRLYAEAFVQSPLVAWLPSAHALSAKSQISLAELVAQPMIQRSKGSQTRAVFEANLTAAGLTFPGGPEVDLQDGLGQLVGAGFGAGVGAALETLHDPRVVTRPLCDAPLRLAEYVICPHERRRSPSVRAFFRAAVAIDW